MEQHIDDECEKRDATREKPPYFTIKVERSSEYEEDYFTAILSDEDGRRASCEAAMSKWAVRQVIRKWKRMKKHEEKYH